MEILMAVLVGLLFSMLRTADGLNLLPKSLCVLLMIGILFAILPDIQSPIPLFVTAITFAIGICPGWGKYFACISGKYNPIERESPIIDPLLDGWGENHPYLAGIVGMSLRWFIYFLPFFIWFWAIDIIPLYNVLGLLSVGVIYYICGRIVNYLAVRTSIHPNFGTTLAEIITGFLLGVLVVI